MIMTSTDAAKKSEKSFWELFPGNLNEFKKKANEKICDATIVGATRITMEMWVDSDHRHFNETFKVIQKYFSEYGYTVSYLACNYITISW